MKTAILALCAMFVGATCLAEGAMDAPAAALAKRLDSILIPTIEFRDANIGDVVEFLAKASKLNDPDKTGVNIVLMDKDNEATITMTVERVSLHKALQLVAEMAGLSLDLEDQVVLLRKPREAKP